MTQRLTDAQLYRLFKLAMKKGRPLLGIGPEWQVFWKIYRTDSSNCGHCNTDPEYRKAWLTIWPENDPERLCHTIVHELLHITHWPFLMYARQVDFYSDKNMRKLDQHAYDIACEQYVAMWLQATPVKALIRELEDSIKPKKK